MPVRVFYRNNQEQPCTIRPTPLVSINTETIKNGASEIIGVKYSITLTGKLIANAGTPYGVKQDLQTKYPFAGGVAPNFVGPYGAFDSNVSHFDKGRPPLQIVSELESSNSIFSKQRALRALFAEDGQLLYISDFNDDEATIICYPRVLSVSFSEGIYVDVCDYRIELECDTLLNKNTYVDLEGTNREKTYTYWNFSNENLRSEEFVLQEKAAFITDYNESWSIEVDETFGESIEEVYVDESTDPYTYSLSGIHNPRTYKINHSINATGKTHYTPSGTEFDVVKIPAWESARNFVQTKLGLANDYPNVMGIVGSGTLNLINQYRGFNHIRTEDVSVSDGTYSVFESWLISSGTAYEQYNISINSDTANPFVKVSIDGNIKGLTEITPSGYNGAIASGIITAYQNALNKYNKISNSGQFGLTSDIFARANNVTAVQLNSQPLSVSISANKYIGEINYGISFDNRPTNIISGVLSESISVNDTYPGDVFAIIPVIGRKTGPVLQYIGGRTEYKRDVSINLLMDYNQIPYGSTRNTILLQKPSVVEPTATQLSNLITELSPAYESGVRKYFLSPPSESWNPKEGSYNLNLSWTYELDK